MKLRILLLFALLVNLGNIVLAGGPAYTELKDGVVIFTDPAYTGISKAVKIEIVSEKIIRVTAAPDKEIVPVNSLITVYQKNPDLKWKLVPSGEDSLKLETAALKAVISLKTGVISFYDASGQRIVGEKPGAGRLFKPVVFDGKQYHSLVQSFETSAEEAWYGLGQHQDGVINYKGSQVTFFQNNTEVAIPFLVSSKGYGILWDNYSLSTAGDVRTPRQLSALQLFSGEGDEGWLTASYFNSTAGNQQPVLKRAESDINMEFLGDAKVKLPKEFNPAAGKVVWEGSIASHTSGLHNFRFTFGGTIRVWCNGKLVLEHWRKAWNPAPALLPLNLEDGKKLAIKIEWVPEGTESYIALKWLEPLGQKEKDVFSFSSEAGRQIDYYLVYGNNIDEVIAGYRTLTGKAAIVPRWAMGFWQSRERYKTQDEILSAVAEFRKRKIPLDNIVLDWSYWPENAWGSQEFEAARFPSPEKMMKTLHEKYNTQLMISVWPKFYENIPTYNFFNKKGWLYKRNIADRQIDWIAQGYVSTFYDAFNEDARKGFWKLINEKIYSKGIDAWWMDASEPDILSNVDPGRRKQQMTPTALGSAAEYLNAYPLQNAKGIYEGQRSTSPDKRVFLLTRSGFAGSQRYAAAIWSGDIGSTWHDMKAQIAAGVNFSMSGLPFWTMDIGGFVVPEKFEKPDAENLEEWRELVTRWSQFGSLVPLFRSHGQFPYREIYNIAPEDHPAYKSFLYYDKLRYRLLPYIYSLAGATYHNDYTIMRGLAMDFAKDTAVLNIADQFLFGPSLLVNPVCQYKKRNRDLYLPACEGWYDLYSGKWYKGQQHINADAPYERMPVFVKAGSVIPFGPDLQYAGEKRADTIILNIYTGADASFNLYEDEGTNYNYEKGAFSIIPIGYNEGTKTLTIGDRQGAFNNMPSNRTFLINIITPDRAKQLSLNGKYDKKISYRGQQVKMKI